MELEQIDYRKLLDAIRMDEFIGCCRECGAKAYGVEPNARQYTCDVCGADAVYGAEELFLMGE